MKNTLSRQVALLGTWSIAITLFLLLLCFRGTAADFKAEPSINALALTTALQPSGTLTPTHQAYLPTIDKTSPPLTETLKTKYLFVEHWLRKEASQDCPWPTLTSLPVYSFHSTTGVLIVYPPNPDFVLQAEDIGYIGTGASSGYLYANYLYRFHEISLSVGEMTLYSVDDAGFVSLGYLSEAITLAPRASWISSTISQTSEITTCFVTTTDRITNYAFQWRDKIEYYSLP